MGDFKTFHFIIDKDKHFNKVMFENYNSKPYLSDLKTNN